MKAKAAHSFYFYPTKNKILSSHFAESLRYQSNRNIIIPPDTHPWHLNSLCCPGGCCRGGNLTPYGRSRGGFEKVASKSWWILHRIWGTTLFFVMLWLEWKALKSSVLCLKINIEFCLWKFNHSHFVNAFKNNTCDSGSSKRMFEWICFVFHYLFLPCKAWG